MNPMHNRAFYRSLHSISHPISIRAIILLLLNDHFLKQHYSTWWTGKLSDFAGLIFAPLIFAAFLAWIIPSRLKNQETIVSITVFVLTGIIFALTKTLPQMNKASSEFWEFFAGGPVKMWLDPTDLLVLPALLIGWLVWDNNSDQIFRPLFPASGIMILGFLSALASTPGNADNGIVCLAFDKSSLIAWTGQHGSNDYLTGNGRIYIIDPDAITSNTTTANTRQCNHVQRNPVWQLASPNDPNLIYRFALGQSIEVSENAGRNWQSVIDLENIANENRMRAKDRTNIWTGFVAQPGPLDAVFDPSGNKLYVAMGLDGVLVIQKDKKPIWVSVGNYRFDVPRKIDTRFFELWPHLGMAIGATFITMIIVNPKTHRKKATIISYAVCALIWTISLISIQPVPYMRTLSQFDLGISPICMVAVFPFALAGLAESKYRQEIKLKSATKMNRVLMAATLLVAILPFYLWQTLDNSNTYAIATYSSIASVLGIQVIGLKLSNLPKI